MRCRWCDEDYNSITEHWLRHCPAMIYWQELMTARLTEHENTHLDDRDKTIAILNSQNAVVYEEITGLLRNFPLQGPNSKTYLNNSLDDIYVYIYIYILQLQYLTLITPPVKLIVIVIIYILTATRQNLISHILPKMTFFMNNIVESILHNVSKPQMSIFIKNDVHTTYQIPT